MFKSFFTVKNILFLVSIIALLFIIPKIAGILLLFFASYVIACALNPYVEKLQKRKINRAVASSLVLTASCAGVIAVFLPIFLIAFKEIKTFTKMLPAKIELLTNYLINLDIFGLSIQDIFDKGLQLNKTTDIAQNIFNQSWNFTMALGEFFVLALAITMIVFYLLVDKNYLKDKFVELFPQDLKAKALTILKSISLKVGSYIRAQIISMLAIGIMVTIYLWLMRIDYAILLGLISGILDIIPILGPAIALAVIVLVAYQLGMTKVIIAVILFLVVQQLSNYIVRPFLFGKFMKLHPLTMFFALFVGQQFLGLWGVILAPALAATVCVLIDELYILPINSNNE